MFFGEVKIKETGAIESSGSSNELRDAEAWIRGRLTCHPNAYSWGRVIETRTIMTLRPEITLVPVGDDE